MDSLTKEFTVKFTKQQLIAIVNNLLVEPGPQGQPMPRLYPVADGAVIQGIVSIIRPFVRDTEQPVEGPTKPVDAAEDENVIIGTDADGEDTTAN